jgi:alpha-L-rhamnosidase
LKGRQLALEVIIPANTTATVCFPAKNQASITENGKPADKSDGVRFVCLEQNKAVFEVGSGTYRFVSEM